MEMDSAEKQKPKVIVFENNKIISKIISNHLYEAGFDSKVFNSYVEVLEKMREEKPDLIICNIIMPDILGYEAIKTLKKEGEFKEVPIIIYDNMCDEKSIKKSLKLGAEEFLCKTEVEPADLVKKVKEILKVNPIPRKIENKEGFHTGLWIETFLLPWGIPFGFILWYIIIAPILIMIEQNTLALLIGLSTILGIAWKRYRSY